ncbi:MAG: hypothetical protein IT303_13775 [Dehalococcoidia bacterium]|nr:hypothetical protein [Dehalococcoidia bacterium]
MSVSFPGRDELRVQVAAAELFDDCGNAHGCVEFRYPDGLDLPRVPGRAGAVPIEATGEDGDGHMVNVFLHVRDGIADYVVVYSPPGDWPHGRPVPGTLCRIDIVPDSDDASRGTLVPREVTLYEERG